MDRICFWVLYLWGQLYFIRDGGAYLLDGKISGYSWYNYLRQAWLIERRIARQYNYFREPLYGGIVGKFGEISGSYPNSAILLSSVSGSFASLLLGCCIWRAFPKNGGFWGGFVALSMSMSAGFVPVGRWGNHYTLLMMATVFFFWTLFVAIEQRGKWGWVGLSCGLACAVDQRSFIWIAVGGMLCVLLGGGWKSRLINMSVVGIGGLGIPHFFRWYFAEDSKHRLSTAQVLDFQREVVSRWSLGDVSGHTTMCAAVPEEEYLRWSFLFSDCSRELIAWNWSDKISIYLLFPSLLVWGCLGLLWGTALRHRSTRWRTTVLLLSLIVASTWFWSALMPLPARYLPSICVGLALIVPFACAAVEAKRSLVGRWGLRAIALGAALYCCYQLPSGFEARKEIRRQQTEQQRYWEIWQIVERYREGAAFLDCAEKGLNALLLPQRYVEQPFHQLRNRSDCTEWIREGSGEWVLVSPVSTLRDLLDDQEHWKLYYQSKDLDFSLWKLERPAL